MDEFGAKHLEAGYMQTSGSALLKLMQNKETPVLDLFVRESIQNSLDASLPDAENVVVDFVSGSFDVQKLASKYSVIKEKLKSNYGEINDFISISDKNTVGLVGNEDGLFEKGEENQNLGKLVFQIMDPQTRAGAGGCWGIGKTIYYRLGIGLVLYYSRIRIGDKFEERIISTLVEDERSGNRLITDKPKYIGITYFGNTKGENPKVICESEFSASVLQIFGIQPYTNEETGTVVIVPFVNKQKLLSDVKYSDNDKPFWKSEITDFLRMATLKWYFPRLNSKYKYTPKLITKVDGIEVVPNENTPLFGKLTKMYECIVDGKEREGIKVCTIERNQDFENIVLGHFAFLKLTKFELKMMGSGCDENLPSPFCYSGTQVEMSDQNPPLVAFCRKPGMIVSYETASEWVGSGINGGEGFIIGLFVLNSDNKFKNLELTLEEYVRGSEKADHTSWSDYNIENGKGQKWIIKNITKAISSKLKDAFVEKRGNEETNSTNRVLGKKFADLLPTYNFGQDSSVDGRGRSGTSIGKSKQTSVKMIGKPRFDESGMKVEFEIVSKGNLKELEIFLQVATTSKMICLNEWEGDDLNYICNINKIFAITEKIIPMELKATNGELIGDMDIISGKLKIKQLKTKNGNVYGIKLINQGIESFKTGLAICVEIIDNAYQMAFASSIVEEVAV